METNKWWLIHSNDIKSIRKALEDSGHEDALHDLDSGLHTTTCTPDDYKDKCWAVKFLARLPEEQRFELMRIATLIGDPLSQELLKKAVEDES